MTSGLPGSAGVVRDADRESVVWHDVECSGYTADLAAWRELAIERPGEVLELGAGTGRVALDLAERGHRVWALDADRALVEELLLRAQQRGLDIGAAVGDARALSLGRRFDLALAPMQVVQLLGGPEGRASMLAGVHGHLERGGRLAVALADPLEGIRDQDPLPPLPDVREDAGWVYSSRPVSVRQEDRDIAVERVREAVSPAGELTASEATIRLERLEAAELAGQAAGLGFRALEPRRVPATDAYVGSTIVVLEAV